MKSRDEGEPYQLKNKQDRRVSLLCLCHCESRLTPKPKSTSSKGVGNYNSTFLLPVRIVCHLLSTPSLSLYLFPTHPMYVHNPLGDIKLAIDVRVGW